MGVVADKKHYIESNKENIYQDYFNNNISAKLLSVKYNVSHRYMLTFIKKYWNLKSPSERSQKYGIYLSLFEKIDCGWKAYF